MESAICLVCRSPAKPKQFFTSAEVTESYVREFDFAPPQLRGELAFVLLHCEACELEFFDPLMTGDAAFYDWVGERGNYASWRWEFDPILELAQEFGGVVVEVGAGAGHLTAALLRLGLEVVAVEPSAMARQRLDRHAGLTVLSDVTQVLESNMRGDLVVSCHVLEHVDDPLRFLADLRAITRVGGRLAVSVPQYKSLMRPSEPLEAYDCPPHHVTRWTSLSLTAALVATGLSDVGVLRDPLSNVDAARALSIALSGRDRRWLRGPLNRSGLAGLIARHLARGQSDRWSSRNIVGIGTRRTNT